jgi:2-methylthioadenine synthetase
MIRKLREEHPQALCAVCGCWSQLSPEDAASIGADVVHGSGSKQAFVDDILRAFREHAHTSRAWIIRSSALTLSRCRRARPFTARGRC